MAQYGTSQYGTSQYGPGTPTPPTPTTYCQDYTRFRISGVNLGVYQFELNPDNYDPFPERQVKTYSTVMDSNPTIEREYLKNEITMSWSRLPERMWGELSSFTRKNTDGRSEEIYFWDGEIGEYIKTRIRVTSLEARAVGGMAPIDRTDVTMRIRRVF